MTQQPLLFGEVSPGRGTIIPRYYQTVAHDEAIRLFDSGVRGALIRSWTGSGKTLMACLIADTWLQRSSRHRVMVISYERDLVYQFAQEIYDWLSIHAGIEMASERIDYDNPPAVTVASRASLLCWPPPTAQQLVALTEFGIDDTGPAAKRHVERYLKYLKANKATPDEVRDDIRRLAGERQAHGNRWGRLYCFDWRYHWLLIYDEAHKHAHHLRSVHPIVEWFSQNPETRQLGITATPKRSDNVSIGHKMFPGIALDMPLCKPNTKCGVSEGFAVPYVQRYIEVNGVDFRSINRIGKDFDEADLGRVLGKEETLASCIEPLLDMVGDRQTLIFSPTVQMAKDVAEYINARSRCRCACSRVKWYPTLLIGDGAKCPDCGRMVEPGDVDKSPDRAKEIDGSTPTRDRRPVYAEFEAKQIQFLSVCGLCREGYNNPSVSCVAIFRPVSKAASSLAEQMKGRASRPLPGLIDRYPGEDEADKRLEAIRNSEKPNALIVDLVGVTGLADCASTVQIYAEGLPDEIAQRAEEILLETGLDNPADVGEAIERAEEEDRQAREAARLEREAAEARSREMARKRAKAQAEVDYAVYERGAGSQIDSKEATDKQYRYMAFLGMEIFDTYLTKRQAGRIINQLKEGMPLEEVAYANGIDERNWQAIGPTSKQMWALRKQGIRVGWLKTKRDASYLLDAVKEPEGFVLRFRKEIEDAATDAALTHLARTLGNVRSSVHIAPEHYELLVNAGKARRQQLVPTDF